LPHPCGAISVYGHPLSEVSTISLGGASPDCCTPSSFSKMVPTFLYVHDCFGFPFSTSIPVPVFFRSTPSGISTTWLHLALCTDSYNPSSFIASIVVVRFLASSAAESKDCLVSYEQLFLPPQQLLTTQVDC
ncbi:hypothetical protein TcCL_NonESM08113, partial [Trypanosoma cruzi]